MWSHLHKKQFAVHPLLCGRWLAFVDTVFSLFFYHSKSLTLSPHFVIILPVVRLFNDFLWSLAAVLASCVDVPMLIVPIYHSIVGFFFLQCVCLFVCVCVCVCVFPLPVHSSSPSRSFFLCLSLNAIGASISMSLFLHVCGKKSLHPSSVHCRSVNI